jgi:hypothetical protein
MTASPPGTPFGAEHAEVLAPVWCTHGVRFEPEAAGYRPTDIDVDHPDIPCTSPGAIPKTCQPTVAYDPAEYPNAGPHGAASVLGESATDDEP